jgi:hypothetical protein
MNSNFNNNYKLCFVQLYLFSQLRDQDISFVRICYYALFLANLSMTFTASNNYEYRKLDYI